jgi:Domain of unknown function (DUF4333)
MMRVMGSRWIVRPALAVAGLLAAVALSACEAGVSIGGDKTIDSADLERSLSRQVAAKGVDPSDLPVACPDGQKVETGATLTCTLTDLAGNEQAIEVTLTDDEGGYDARIIGKATADR